MTANTLFAAPLSPLFSVVVPAYNAERYLDECLSSVVGQTFDDFELIVVNDGSTDSTTEILERFVRGHKSTPVVLLRQDNRGLLAARRAGLEAARGKYVVFLDADDALRAETLATLSEEIARTCADVVAFGMTNDVRFECPRFCGDLPFGYYEGQDYDLVKRVVLRGRFNNLCGKAISLAALDSDVDYSFYFGLMHGEDLFQLLPTMDKAESCVHIDKALYYYRRHEGSSTMSYKHQQLEDIEVVSRRLLEYGKRWGMPQDAAFGALWNICCTAKTLLKDRSCSSIWAAELRRFASVVEGLGLTVYLNDQRLDNLLLLRAIMKGKYREAVGIVRMLELFKKVFRNDWR